VHRPENYGSGHMKSQNLARATNEIEKLVTANAIYFLLDAIGHN
jgi:hypothetical protein